MGDRETIMENATSNTTTNESVNALMVVEYVLFTVIFIVGVVGNSLVCLVILKTPSMRSTRNYLIVNLAIADITVALVCIPFDVIIRVHGDHWVLGGALCKVIWPSMTLVTTCSAATLAAISYDRYRAVVHPWKAKLTAKQTALVVLVTWMFSLLVVLPYMTVLKLQNSQCNEFWHKDLYRKMYTAFLFAFAYSLPLVIIALAYTRVALKLKKQADRIASNKKASGIMISRYSWANKRPLSKDDISENATSSPHPSRKECALLQDYNSGHINATPSPNTTNTREQKKLERNTRIVKMLVTVVLFYACCLLPNQVVWMWIEFGNGNDYSNLSTLLSFTGMLVYINSIVNPFLYAGMNDEFKKGFGRLLRCRGRAILK